MTRKLDFVGRIADAAGCTGFNVVRQRVHFIVDFTTASNKTVRMALPVSPSDSKRGEKNAISTLKRLIRERSALS